MAPRRRVTIRRRGKEVARRLEPSGACGDDDDDDDEEEEEEDDEEGGGATPRAQRSVR